MTPAELRNWKSRFVVRDAVDVALLRNFVRCAAKYSAIIELPDGTRTEITKGKTYCHPDAAEVRAHPELFAVPVLTGGAWQRSRARERQRGCGATRPLGCLEPGSTRLPVGRL